MSKNDREEKRDVGAVINFALDASDLSNDDMIEELSKCGVDVDVAIPKILLGINNTLFGKTWTDTAYKNKASMSSISKDVIERLSSSKDEMISRIKDLLCSGQLQIQHRDYSSLTEDDLISLLEDSEFLRELDESKRKS